MLFCYCNVRYNTPNLTNKLGFQHSTWMFNITSILNKASNICSSFQFIHSQCKWKKKLNYNYEVVLVCLRMTSEGHSPFDLLILDGFRLNHARFNIIRKSILIWFNGEALSKIMNKKKRQNVPGIKTKKENKNYLLHIT